MKYKGNKFVILLLILLGLSSVWIVDASLDSENEQADTGEMAVDDRVLALSLESGVFDEAALDRNHDSIDYTGTGRNLAEYYANRAFHGAPPIIPHEVLNEQGIGGKNCLQCHEHGGYVPRFKAFAPVTPHPEFTSCKQCHVPQNTSGQFKPTNWVHPGNPPIKQKALSSSPPVIPHNVHLRENCQSCHVGPAAVEPIRVTHPERTNCQQCHAKGSEERHSMGIWDRNDTTNQELIRY